MALRFFRTESLFAAAFIFIACSTPKPSADPFGGGISAQAIAGHLEFLSDDLLEGRGTGSRGNRIAAKYIATQFATMGLAPGMPDSQYFQPLLLRRSEVVPEATSMVVAGPGGTVKFRYATDFYLSDTHGQVEGEISAPVVFAGYGVTAPEINHDDYDNLDVKGKLVALLVFQAPANLPSEIRSYYSSMEVKRATAAARGALGIIAIRVPVFESMLPWTALGRELSIGANSLRWIETGGDVHGDGGSVQAFPILSRSAADVLFAGEKYSTEQIFAATGKNDVPCFETNKTATIRFQSRHTNLESQNIVGLLEGSDPVLRKEFVVLTTHMDHLGIGPEANGDNIYNGALDNASGTAMLLEVARAFAQLPVRPRRSVFFVAVTAEEQGLLGSDYFANNPPVPIEDIVANINVDEAIPIWPSLRDAVIHGANHSSLGTLAEQASRESAFELSPDPYPEQAMFVRTDHYSFVRKGVPAVYVEMGYKSSKPGIDLLAMKEEWLSTRYHSPTDDLTLPFDFDTGAKFARFVGLLTFKAAMEPERPSWNDGDFFASRSMFGTAK